MAKFTDQNRAFEGVWIPKSIWLNDTLSIAEKCLLVEIKSLDNDPEKGCFASNEYLASFLSVSEGRLANMLTDLKKRGLISQIYFDGRSRGLRVSVSLFYESESRVHENGKAGFTKTGKRDSRKRESGIHENGNIVLQYSNTMNSTTENSAKNEFSPDTDEALAVYSVEIHEPVKVETIALPKSPKKGTTSNGARRDDLGDDFAEMLESELGVKIVTVQSGEPIPDTLGKPRKGKRQEIPQPFEETQEAFSYFSNPDKISAVWLRWLAYKKQQHGERYKTADSEKTQLRALFRFANGDADRAEQIVEQSIGNLWKGLFQLKTENPHGTATNKVLAAQDELRRGLAEHYAARRLAAME